MNGVSIKAVHQAPQKPFILVLAVIGCLVGQVAWAHQFSLGVVDPQMIDMDGTDIALDSQGGTGICYHDTMNGVLRFASRRVEEGGWRTEVVDDDGGSGNSVGGRCALLFDRQDLPHIVYYKGTTDELRHAYRFEGRWRIGVIDAQAHLERLEFSTNRLSIAMNSRGIIGVAYYDSLRRDLLLAEWDGAGWQKERVAHAGDVGRFPSLAYDRDDRPAISAMRYRNANSADLFLTRFDGSDWRTETVDEDHYAGAYSSLVFDSQGVPHVAYQQIAEDRASALRYTSKRGGRWNRPLVLMTGGPFSQTGSYARMVLTGNGHAYVISRTYFFSALFGSTYYLKLHSLYFVDLFPPSAVSYREDNIAFSAAPTRDYAGMSIAVRGEDRLVFSAAIENVLDNNLSLKTGRIASWSPAIALESPEEGHNVAVGDRFEIAWRDFDPDSEAQIRFHTVDNQWNRIDLGRVVSEEGDGDEDHTTLDTSALAPGRYRLIAEISDDRFQGIFSDVARTDMIVPERRQPEAPQADPIPVRDREEPAANPVQAPEPQAPIVRQQEEPLPASRDQADQPHRPQVAEPVDLPQAQERNAEDRNDRPDHGEGSDGISEEPVEVPQNDEEEEGDEGEDEEESESDVTTPPTSVQDSPEYDLVGGCSMTDSQGTTDHLTGVVLLMISLLVLMSRKVVRGAGQ